MTRHDDIGRDISRFATVGHVRAAVRASDWDTVRLLLHPYLQWRTAEGSTLRGRINVMAMLREAEVPDPPADVELRDGQIYRWQV